MALPADPAGLLLTLLPPMLCAQMELEHQAGEANMLGSALERYNLGVRDMQYEIGAFGQKGSAALCSLGEQLGCLEG